MAIISPQIERPAWKYFGGYWLLITGVLVPIFALLILPVIEVFLASVGHWVGKSPDPTFGLVILESFIKAIPLGVAQWLLLRWYVKGASRWFVATLVGVTLASLVGLELYRWSTGWPIIFSRVLDVPVCLDCLLQRSFIAGIEGLIIGGCQYLALRYWIQNGQGWIVIVIIAQFFGSDMWVHSRLDALLLRQVAIGILTGSVLAYLLKRSWPEIVTQQRANEYYL